MILIHDLNRICINQESSSLVYRLFKKKRPLRSYEDAAKGQLFVSNHVYEITFMSVRLRRSGNLISSRMLQDLFCSKR